MQNALIADGKIDAIASKPFKKNNVKIPNGAELGDLWDGTNYTQQEAAPTDDDVLDHALALKIGVVNSTKTGPGDYPVTYGALAEIRQHYTEYVAEISAKQIQDETITGNEKNTIGRIQSGFAAFKAINTAAELIINAGNAANPVANDNRWPV